MDPPCMVSQATARSHPEYCLTLGGGGAVWNTPVLYPLYVCVGGGGTVWSVKTNKLKI